MSTLVRLLVVGILCLTTPALTDEVELPQADRMAKHYDGWWFASAEEKSRCVALLRSLTADKVVAPLSPEAVGVDAHMRAARCLDSYSHLYGAEPGTGGGPEKKLDAPAVERFGPYLFVYINTFTDVDSKLVEMVKQRESEWRDSVDTVVVDVRGNIGGKIDELHEILNRLFSPKAGIRHLEPSGRMTFKKNPHHFETDRRGILSGRKIRILADSATASASEWMIETLCNEWYPDSCLSLGSTTFGKAILQCGINDKEFSVQLTCAEWFLKDKHESFAKDQSRVPSRKVQGVGITPDRPMTFTECDRFAYECIATKLEKAGL